MAELRVPLSVPELDTLRMAITDQLTAIRTSLSQLSAAVASQHAALLERITTLATLDQAGIDALTANLTSLGDRLATAIADVRQDIADLKTTQNVDTTALDQSVSRLSGVADDLSALDAENPAPAPADGGTPAAPTA